jgi:hypothetical protein
MALAKWYLSVGALFLYQKLRSTTSAADVFHFHLKQAASRYLHPTVALPIHGLNQ